MLQAKRGGLTSLQWLRTSAPAVDVSSDDSVLAVQIQNRLKAPRIVDFLVSFTEQLFQLSGGLQKLCPSVFCAHYSRDRHYGRYLVDTTPRALIFQRSRRLPRHGLRLLRQRETIPRHSLVMSDGTGMSISITIEQDMWRPIARTESAINATLQTSHHKLSASIMPSTLQ